MALGDEPQVASSSRSSSTEDFRYVFMVELERGPSGLGMGLIDGLVRAWGPHPPPTPTPFRGPPRSGPREAPVQGLSLGHFSCRPPILVLRAFLGDPR